LAQAVFDRSRIAGNPYFTGLTDGTMSLADFQCSQEQFGHNVRAFSRAMAILAARIPTYHQRIDILHNVWEEHGEGRFADSHDASISNFLASIGHPVPPPGPEPVMWPGTRAFNDIIYGACAYEPLEIGICAMGAIEYAFAWISNHIGSHVMAKGWVTGDRLWHYALHEQIDPRHAEEFFLVVEPDMDQPIVRQRIEQGLRLGIYTFDRLYRDLHEGPQRWNER
jgi:pyrroloquinoline-quinone synthase